MTKFINHLNLTDAFWDVLTPTLAELNIAYAGGWSLRRPNGFNLAYSDLFLNSSFGIFVQSTLVSSKNLERPFE